MDSQSFQRAQYTIAFLSHYLVTFANWAGCDIIVYISFHSRPAEVSAYLFVSLIYFKIPDNLDVIFLVGNQISKPYRFWYP